MTGENNKMFKHEASGTELLRAIVRPDVLAFAEIFSGFTTERDAEISPLMWKQDGESCAVGPHVSFRGRGTYFYGKAKVADWVIPALERSTIHCGNRDSISFKIIDHGKGWSLVVADHNIILGGAWLAYIRTDSCPSSLTD